MPAAATRLRDLPSGAAPYISGIDLVVFKINSCGLRAQTSKKRIDAVDTQDLLARLTSHAPLNLTNIQKSAVEQGINDVVTHGTKTKAWWREKLGLPIS